MSCQSCNGNITRGTTPTIIIELPPGLHTTDVTECYLTVNQYANLIFEKDIDGMETDDSGTVSVFRAKLTQAETLALSKLAGNNAQLQVRLKTLLGDALASPIVSTTVEAILKDGEI